MNMGQCLNRAVKLAMVSVIATNSSVWAADVPDFMKIISTNEKVTPKEQVSFDNIYQLNEAMLVIYERYLNMYKQHIRERMPLIMGLFGPKGGRFILYRPGQEPLEAESPPQIYRIAKSVGHCAMVTCDMCLPYVGTASQDLGWVGTMKAYRARVQVALDSLDGVDMKPEERELLRDTLKQIAAFHDKCLAQNSFTYEELQTWARAIKPNLAKLIGIASSAQVGHWWKVLEDWKKMLGPDWDRTYGLVNSIYVARQNNILFTVMANAMGEKAINDRLLLIETPDFTTTPDEMMDAFSRIISDRALGMTFFGNYRLMDYELLGSGGRRAIEAEAAKRGQKALLPPLVPFDSNQWPWRVDPNSGTGPATMEDIH